MADSKPEVEIAFERNAIATRFQAYTTFWTTPVLPVPLPTFSDIRGPPEIKMADSKPEVEIAFERNVIATRFQNLPHILDQARPAAVSADIARHPRITGSQNGGL